MSPPKEEVPAGRSGRRRRGGARDKNVAARKDKPRKQESRTQAMPRPKKASKKAGDGEAVVGMGDHVPAFMLR